MSKTVKKLRITDANDYNRSVIINYSDYRSLADNVLHGALKIGGFGAAIYGVEDTNAEWTPWRYNVLGRQLRGCVSPVIGTIWVDVI